MSLAWLETRIGVGPIAWINEDLPEWGADTPGDQVAAEIAEAGYQGTEMSSSYPQDPVVLKGWLAQRGLELAAAYRWTNFAQAEFWADEIEATKRHIAFCAKAGAHFATVAEGTQSLHWDIRGERAEVTPLTTAQWQRMVEALHICGQYAREHGVTLTVHPHGGTAIESEAEIDRLMALTDPELVGLCADSGHIAYGGGDPAAVFQRHAARIRYVHAKDVRPAVLQACRSNGWDFKQAVRHNVFCTPGTGSLDFPTILRPLAETGYRGWLIVEAEQDPALHHPRTVAERARQYMKKVVGR